MVGTCVEALSGFHRFTKSTSQRITVFVKGALTCLSYFDSSLVGKKEWKKENKFYGIHRNNKYLADLCLHIL